MSAKSVCVIFRSSLAPVVSLAYFCVDSGSGNVTDIECWLQWPGSRTTAYCH